MAVTDFFAGEIATELLKMLITITRKACLCKPSAEQLIVTINELLPIINEIKYSGVELTSIRQMQLDTISRALNDGHELANKVLHSSRWNVYKNLQLSRKMEKVEKKISRFVQGPLQAHVLADVHHARFDTMERFDRLEGSARRLEQRLGSMKIDYFDDNYQKWCMEEDDQEMYDGNLVNMGMEVGKRKVKDMVLDDSLVVIGINGIGGSGKTTLVKEVCRDDDVKSYYNNKILVLTVSQSPNVEQIRQRIGVFLSESKYNGYPDINMTSQWAIQYNNWDTVVPTLVVLDDVWSLEVLQQLIFKVPGCKTLVVSRIKFPSLLNSSYELELLREEDAVSLFCHTAFGRNSIPPGFDEDLVKQIVEKCKGLPLALKVIGASLRDHSEKYWIGAKSRLSRAQPISDSHESELLNRMKLSIDYLSEKVRDCFLDLGSFPEDKRIPLDVLVNIWTELHDIDEEEVYAILVELSNKNLLTLVKDSKDGDSYSSYCEISVSQHDVLRDLAIHMSSVGSVNKRKRLVMARRENGVPKEWERNADQPFLARIVSIHTGEMREMNWLKMEFPKAEVLILNFDSTEYFLPNFIENMPRLRALVLINYNNKTAVLHNLSILSSLTNLTSLWFEKVTIPQLPEKAILPLTNLRKISLLLCKINLNDQSELDLSQLFPRLEELTMDHCIEMTKLPSSICQVKSLKSLSITNCESLEELPFDFGKLIFLRILRVCACPKLKTLPFGIKNLMWLEHIDISQCVNLHCLNEEISGCLSLKVIDMRECPQIKRLPRSVSGLRSLRRVRCDEEIFWLWKQMEKELSGLCVQVAEQCFGLDWLKE
uniref:probable disease resistance protein At4g33300 n=1 Tax=Erigeron canadensis TaxID=72917 RepID=UPI001CB97025|nr:probable disease resistance protein At4g33300 [Erigeron canadensis]